MIEFLVLLVQWCIAILFAFGIVGCSIILIKWFFDFCVEMISR